MKIDEDFTEAIELARELPADVPDLAHREQVRTALLARARTPAAAIPRSRGPLVIGALAAFAGAALFVVARPAEAPPVQAAHDHGNVHARPGSSVARTSRSPDEIVRLHDGTVDIDVEPLGPGDRFRVIVGASEVEVRGTSFTVTAEHDQLVAVQVAHGRVEVRPAGAAATVLVGGQTWHVIVAAAPSPPAPIEVQIERPAPAAPRQRSKTAAIIAAPPPAPAPPARSPQDLAYDEAWDAIRGTRFHEAAAAFARSLALAPEGPLADDARFWHAVALAREPRVDEAISSFRELCDEHPGNAHHGESSAMLGWLLVDKRQLAEAAERFHAAENDPSAKVRASARAGLDALPRR